MVSPFRRWHLHAVALAFPQCGWLAERQGSRPQFTVHGVRAPSYPWRYGISLGQEEDWSPWNYSFSFWKQTNKEDPQDLGISLDHIELDTILITFEGTVKRFVGGHHGGVGLLYCVSSGTEISVSLNVCPFVGERGGGGAPVLCPQLNRDLSLQMCALYVRVWRMAQMLEHTHTNVHFFQNATWIL